VYYFTSTVGDEPALHQIKVALRDFGLEPDVMVERSLLANQRQHLLETQCVIEKPKGADIALAVRMFDDSLNSFEVCHLYTTDLVCNEPRSAAITRFKPRPHTAGSDDLIVFDIDVEDRPKGSISFTGGTKYDGWTAMMLDRTKDGTLLDGHGKPLPEGQPPVY